MVLEDTPFYPEGGGQSGDKGKLVFNNNYEIIITDTKKENGKILHFSKKPNFDISSNVTAVVDAMNRNESSSNHTSTHLLHQALRDILGKHVEQKGSSVSSDGLRFDFSHFSKMSQDEITQVENFVNSKIEDRLKLEENQSIPIKDALSQGALALFGEKYGDVVRTIKFGNSIELCGGTHVNNSSDIWNFKIKSEGAIAAGIRRIEAITSDAVKDYYAENNNQFNHIKSLLNNTLNPVKSVNELKEENINLKKEIELLLNEKANVLRLESIKEIKKVNDINFLSKKVDLDANLLKSISFC